MIIGQCYWNNNDKIFEDSGNNSSISKNDTSVIITFLRKPNKIGLQGDYGTYFTINGKDFYVGRSGILEIEGWQIDTIVFSIVEDNLHSIIPLLIDYAIIEEGDE